MKRERIEEIQVSPSSATLDEIESLAGIAVNLMGGVDRVTRARRGKGTWHEELVNAEMALSNLVNGTK